MDGIPPWDDEVVNPAAERGSSSRTQVGLPRPELEVPVLLDLLADDPGGITERAVPAAVPRASPVRSNSTN